MITASGNDFAAQAADLFTSASSDLNRYRPSDKREENALRDLEQAKVLALLAIADELKALRTELTTVRPSRRWQRRLHRALRQAGV